MPVPGLKISKTPKRILVAPNPFKGSFSAVEAAKRIVRLLKPFFPQAQFEIFPLADGGPGSLEALMAARVVRLHRSHIRDPWGRSVPARWLSLSKKIAFIESAEAVGLKYRRGKKDSPLDAESFGLGELLLEAKALGHREIWVGLGGSATTDAGLGMARALGRFGRMDGIEIRALCDVNNPLYGARGAAFVFAPQKGASPSELKRLDLRLRHLGALMPGPIPFIPGAGAAGGLGAGLMAWAGARLVPGALSLLELCDFEKRLKGTDLLVSGEGRFDRQSLGGKLPWVLAGKAKTRAIPCLLVCGQIEAGLKLGGLALTTLESLAKKDLSTIEK